MMRARGKTHFERKSEITGVVMINSYNKSSIGGDGVGRKSRNSRPALTMLVVALPCPSLPPSFSV